MENFGRLLAYALKKRGVLSEGEVERLVKELTEKLKPRNLLTEKELGEVARRLHHFELARAYRMGSRHVDSHTTKYRGGILGG